MDTRDYFDKMLQRTHRILLGIIVVQFCFNALLCFKVYRSNKLENVFVAFPDQTIAVKAANQTLTRTEEEMYAFTERWLDMIFDNDKHTFEKNTEKAGEWMDEPSAKTVILGLLDSGVESLFQNRNAVSHISVEELYMQPDKVPVSILVEYKQTLNFRPSGKEQYEEEEIPGALSFDLGIVKRSHKNPYGMQIRNLQFLPVAARK